MNREQGRAVVLTAIMVVSVFAMGFAFAGGAAASDVDRNASDGGAVEEGAQQVEVLDFNLTSEDRVLDSQRPNTGNDGDVEPGDDLTPLAPGEYSYIDDNNDEDYDADETLIYDGNGSGQNNNARANDEFDEQSEVIRYTDGAFRPYFFERGDDLFFTDVNNGYGDRGTYTGEEGDYDNDQNVQHEAILRVPTVDPNGVRQINQETNPITTGQANLTAFPTGVDDSNGKAYIHDADGSSVSPESVDYEPDEGDFIFVAGDGDQQYDAGSDDTVVAGPVPPGDESNTQSLAGSQIGDRLFFLDFRQNGEFDANEGDGSEPLVLLTEDENIGNTDTGDALPNTARFLNPADGGSQGDGGIGDNYYEQYDDFDQSGPDNDGEEFEEGADDRDGDPTVKHVGLQSMSSTDTLFLDDEAPDQDPDYTGEDGEDEDVVENDLTSSYPLVDGSQENFKNEDLGPDYGDGFTLDDAVIRGQTLPNSQSGLDLFEERDQVKDDEPDGFEELVLLNERNDGVFEGSAAFNPGPGNQADPTYGDAMVDLTVANTGTATDNDDIAAATLYRETDGNSELSAGDTKVSGSNFQQNDLIAGAPGQYVFQNLDQLYGGESTDDSQQFYVGVNLQEEADGTLQFAIPKYRDGQTPYAFDSQLFPGSSLTATDTGLFLESGEAFSTGPFTDSDGNNPSPNYYDLGAAGSSIPLPGPGGQGSGLVGPGPIVTEQELTIADSEAPPAPGEITASDQDFGSVNVGDSTTRTVSVLNNGGQSVDVDSASVSGADAGAFAVTSGGAPFSLAPGESREITVEFAPGTEGDKSADLDISTANANSETVALSGTAETDGGDGDNEHTLQILGTNAYTPYWLRVPGQITDTTDITSEDTVSGDSANGAVGPGADSYTFTGDPADLQLYVPPTATVEIDGTQVNPDDYESQVSFVGDGDFSSYNFEVKNGEITDNSGLTGEDNIDQSDDAVSGAVAGGSDSYTITGSFEGVDIDGGANLMINGHDADLSTFYSTLRFEGQGSLATYDFSVSGEIENTAGVTGEDTVSQNGADGAIRGGSDVYVYSGTLDSLTTNGNVVVEDENGDEVSDT